MKQQILDILKRYRDTWHTESTMPKRKTLESHADELTALMCYREVRAFIIGKSPEGLTQFPLISVDTVLYHFIDDYPKETILKAIEQYKNERK